MTTHLIMKDYHIVMHKASCFTIKHVVYSLVCAFLGAGIMLYIISRYVVGACIYSLIQGTSGNMCGSQHRSN